MKIKITSDSTCDLSPELLRENDIELFPLFINKGDESFRDGVDIQPADIFAHVAAGGALCSTAAVPVGVFHDRFAELAKEYDAVFHVNIGSGFSASHQNAVLAAEDLPNVYVIDSRNLSTGQGHVVLEACRLAKTATDPEEMYRQLNAFAPTVDASFLLDRLDYMVKGDRLENHDDLLYDTIFITHTPVPQEILDTVNRTVRECGSFKHIYETNAGCTISCHCGEGTLGVLYLHKPKN